MSHQSGITVSQALKDAFGAANSASSRCYIIAKVEDEQVVESKTVECNAAEWRDDLDSVATNMTETDAAYVLFKTDNGWLLISYVPDKAKVKAKMLYASTRATVKRTLGTNFFIDELHGTIPGDVNRAGYEAHLAHEQADAPLTHAEYTRREEEELGEIYTGGASTYVHGVAFPCAAGVVDSLKQLVAGGPNYVCLGVDTSKEEILLNTAKALTIDQLAAEVSLTTPQFHFLRYKHESYDEIIFVFTCPDGTGATTACPIKERMLYSSSKARVVSLLQEAGGQVEKSFEFNEPADVVPADIDNALHPPAAVKKAAFKKPTRPGRGKRSLIRKK